MPLTQHLARDLRASDFEFVVTGANGWLGRATLHALHDALGSEFLHRVTALGSRHSCIDAVPGQSLPVHTMLDWRPVGLRPLMVFHYAFLTKDTVAGMSQEEYTARNDAIASQVRQWICSGRVAKMMLPSSGAVYDHLQPSGRDPAAGLYGRLKWQDEEMFSEICERQRCGLVIARVFNLAGPYINKFNSYALASFIVQTLQHRRITINATRPVIRSYYLVTDLLELCLRLFLAQPSSYTERFDTAGYETVELSALAQRILRSVGADEAQVVRPPQISSIPPDNYVGNSQRIRELERSLSINPAPLDQQIDATRLFITNALRA